MTPPTPTALLPSLENVPSMAEKTLPAVDAVVVGSGWAGSILAKELCEAGLSVVMLERGPRRSTAREGAYPSSLDELEGAVRYKLFQNPAQTTVTVRNRMDQEAVPYRRLAAFLPGAGVGGAGLHWTGVHFRAPPARPPPAQPHSRTLWPQFYSQRHEPSGLRRDLCGAGTVF